MKIEYIDSETDSEDDSSLTGDDKVNSDFNKKEFKKLKAKWSSLTVRYGCPRVLVDVDAVRDEFLLVDDPVEDSSADALLKGVHPVNYPEYPLILMAKCVGEQ